MKTSKYRFSQEETQKLLNGLLKTYNKGAYEDAFSFLRDKVANKEKRGIDIPGLAAFIHQNIPQPKKNSNSNPYQVIFHDAINLKNGEQSCHQMIEELSKQFEFEKVGKPIAMEFLSHIDELVRALPKNVRSNSRLPTIDEIGAHALHSLLLYINEEKTTDLSIQLKRCLVLAWSSYYDQHLLKNKLNDVLFGGCYLDENTEYQYNEWAPGAAKFQYYNRLKNDFRSHILQQLHKTHVDGEAHFQAIDSEFKTNEGLAVMAVSGGVVIESSLPQGTTWLQLSEEDSRTAEKSAVKGMVKVYEQHFHTYYRRWLQQYYEPKEFDDLKEQSIKYLNHTFSVYELISLSSLIMAASEMIRDNPLFAHPALCLSDMIKKLCSSESISEVSVPEIVELESTFPVNEQVIWPLSFYSIEREHLFSRVRRITEFADWTNEKLNALFGYLFSKQIHQGFYKNGSKISFNIHSILAIQYAGLIHQRIIAGSLYSNQRNREKGTSNAREREDLVIHQLTDLFKKGGYEVISNLCYSLRFKNKTFKGELDLLILSKREKTGLIIELKLNNSGAFDSRSQFTWAERHLPKAKEQLLKDIAYLNQVKKGVQAFTKGYDIQGFKFSGIVLTDHFFFDHHKLTLLKSKKAPVLSTFELRCLLDPHISGLIPETKTPKAKSLHSLISLLFNNTFWKAILPTETKFNEFTSKNLNQQIVFRH